MPCLTWLRAPLYRVLPSLAVSPNGRHSSSISVLEASLRISLLHAQTPCSWAAPWPLLHGA
eukprot:8708751-Alexandrium_andersonii.AAC.1